MSPFFQLNKSIPKRNEVSVHLLALISEFAQIKLEFNKKLKQVCKKHYLKANKQNDTCFNAYKALLDFIHYTSDYIEQTSKQITAEISKIGFEKCLGQFTKSKEKVLDTLKRDEQHLGDAKKTLFKVISAIYTVLTVLLSYRLNMKITEEAKHIIKRKRIIKNT